MTTPVLFKSPLFAPFIHPIRDQGISGVRVACSGPLRVNDEHIVGLILPSGQELRCQVRVVWSGSGRTGQPEAGLQIVGADADLGPVWQILEEHSEPAVEPDR